MKHIKIGMLTISLLADKRRTIEQIFDRYYPFVDEGDGMIQVEIIETNFKPEKVNQNDNHLYFSLYSDNVYVCINYFSWVGKMYIADETPVKMDAVETAIMYIASQFLPLSSSVLMHGALIGDMDKSFCAIGSSGVGKSTLCKIFGANGGIYAEDMILLECNKNIIKAIPIPLGQKHYWCDKVIAPPLTCIIQLSKGLLHYEKMSRTIVIKAITENQFFLNMINDYLYRDAFTRAAMRIVNNVPVYLLAYEAERFYQKDRRYLADIKSVITDILKDAEKFSNGNCSINDNIQQISLSDAVQIRIGNTSGRLELWDPRNHRLYGLTNEAKDFVSSLNNLSGKTIQIEAYNSLQEKAKNQINILIDANILYIKG